MGLKIEKTASYLPGEGIDNFYFENILDTSDKWISSRTGIKKRHFVEDEDMLDMVEKAIKALDLTKKEIKNTKTIIVATCTYFQIIPNLSSQVQRIFGFGEDVYSLDINMACSGFVAGLNLLNNMVKNDEYAILIGTEIFSEILDFEDRNTAVLFGDGVGAVLLSKSKEKSLFQSGTKGNFQALNYDNSKGALHMAGRDVYKFGVTTIPKDIKIFLEKNDIDKDEVDYFISHQANIRILKSMAKTLRVSLDKFPTNLEKVGNISAASIPILLDDLNKSRILKRGQKLILLGFGAGLTWSLAYLKW